MESRDTQWYLDMAKKTKAVSSEIRHEIHTWKLKHDVAYKMKLMLLFCVSFVLPRIKNKTQPVNNKSQ
jgi:hypothetical protein